MSDDIKDYEAFLRARGDYAILTVRNLHTHLGELLEQFDAVDKAWKVEPSDSTKQLLTMIRNQDPEAAGLSDEQLIAKYNLPI